MSEPLSSTVSLRYGRIGIPTSCTATLHADRIELVKKNTGELIEVIPIAEIAEVANIGGCILVKRGEKLYGLEFLRLIFKMFGLIGMLLDRRGWRNSKAWIERLKAQGVTVKRKLF